MDPTQRGITSEGNMGHKTSFFAEPHPQLTHRQRLVGEFDRARARNAILNCCMRQAEYPPLDFTRDDALMMACVELVRVMEKMQENMQLRPTPFVITDVAMKIHPRPKTEDVAPDVVSGTQPMPPEAYRLEE